MTTLLLYGMNPYLKRGVGMKNQAKVSKTLAASIVNGVARFFIIRKVLRKMNKPADRRSQTRIALFLAFVSASAMLASRRRRKA